MSTVNHGQNLHDRATRGESLTPEEQTELGKWYAKLDEEEAALLSQSAPSKNLLELQAQVEQTLARLPIVLQRVRDLSAENEQLKHEVAELKVRYAQSPAKTS